MALGKAEFEQSKLQVEKLLVYIGIVGNTTQPSIKTYCKNIPSVLVYNEDDTRTVTAVDSGIGFALTDLDNDAPPAVLGILIPVTDAVELVGVELVPNSIKSYSMSAPATALGTVTFSGAAAVNATDPTHDSGGKQGVTASKNLAFVFALTSLDIDEDASTIENNSCWLQVFYRKSQPGY